MKVVMAAMSRFINSALIVIVIQLTPQLSSADSLDLLRDTAFVSAYTSYFDLVVKAMGSFFNSERVSRLSTDRNLRPLDQYKQDVFTILLDRTPEDYEPALAVRLHLFSLLHLDQPDSLTEAQLMFKTMQQYVSEAPESFSWAGFSSSYARGLYNGIDLFIAILGVPVPEEATPLQQFEIFNGRIELLRILKKSFRKYPAFIALSRATLNRMSLVAQVEQILKAFPVANKTGLLPDIDTLKKQNAMLDESLYSLRKFFEESMRSEILLPRHLTNYEVLAIKKERAFRCENFFLTKAKIN